MTTRSVKAAEAAVVPERDVMRLYHAVANYVKKAGGSVLVTGGVQIIQWPGDGEFRFSVAVLCTGRKPDLAALLEKKGKR